MNDDARFPVEALSVAANGLTEQAGDYEALIQQQFSSAHWKHTNPYFDVARDAMKEVHTALEANVARLRQLAEGLAAAEDEAEVRKRYLR